MEESKRKLNDWLSGYLQYTKDTEPPLSYHIWTAISTIASTLQRRCYIKWGLETHYPNQYIVIVGPSGASRKGVAITIGKHFLDSIGVPQAAQALTRERLIQIIGNNQSSFTNTNGGVVLQHALTVVSAELSVFLKQKDIDLLSNLTDMYDCPNNWSYETKGSSSDHLSNVCLNILGATAPDWLPSMLPPEAVGGGFTSRIIFVVEEGKGKVIADPNKFGVNQTLRDSLQSDLERIYLMTGEYKFEDEARELYINWYEGQERSIKKGRYPIYDPKFSGYTARRATHIKKLSMCLSASRGEDYIIHVEDFKRAQRLLETTEKKMPKAFSGLGKSKFADQLDTVTQYIVHNHMHGRKSLRSEVLANMSRDLDSWTLEQIERTLEQMKKIKRIIHNDEQDVEYQYIGSDIPRPQDTFKEEHQAIDQVHLADQGDQQESPKHEDPEQTE